MKLSKMGLLLVTAAMPFSLAACFTGGSADADALKVALQFNPVADFSPYSDDATLSTRAGATEMLVAIGNDGSIQPELAEKWEMKDARTAVFQLREGVTFQDGTPMDAKAVAAALQSAIDAPTRPKGLGKADLKATATGDREVTVNSSEDDPVLVQRFSDPGTMILSPAAYEGEAPNPFGHGTGPFTLTTKNADGTVSAEAFDQYWKGAPETKSLTISFIEDAAARTNSLRAGEQDVVKGLPVTALQEIGSDEVTEIDLPRAVLMYLNTKTGVFADKDLRTAVAGAIDTQSVVSDIFEGVAGDARGSIFNRSAQWANIDGDGTFTAEKSPLAADPKLGEGKTIRLATWDSRAEQPEIANLIADQLRKLGFTVDITVADYNALEKDLLAGEFDAVIGSRNYMLGAADPVSFLQSDFSCEGSYNIPQLCDAEIDSEIAKAATITDPNQRLEAAARIGKDLVADGAVVSLAHEKQLLGAKDVDGLATDSMERHVITEKTSK